MRYKLRRRLQVMNQVAHVYHVTHANRNEIQIEEEIASNEPSDPCVPFDPPEYTAKYRIVELH
jgi:hypothetical protein